MFLHFEHRPSDSPLVEKIWRTRSDRGGSFVSIAAANFEMAVTRHQGRTFLTLPAAATGSFWLDGSAWEYPDFENAEAFVARLVQKGILTRDPAVDAIVGRQPLPQSVRSAQRHFLRATGLTHRAVRQIERARHATNLLRQGTSILDVVHDTGYFDQAHLTRSLKHLIGQTPVEISCGQTQLSFLYKTEPRL